MADPNTDGVTVGALLNAARELGADVSAWEKISDASGQEALYVPGNEEVCRRQLDRVVAADPLTYTLGDQSGPLASLEDASAHAKKRA